jgi:hypothetical protein
MSDERETPDYTQASLGELGEAIQGAAHSLGIWTGYCQAAAALRKKAGEWFAAGRDEKAVLCRDLAAELEQHAATARTSFDTWGKPREQAAFSELTKRQPAGASSGDNRTDA